MKSKKIIFNALFVLVLLMPAVPNYSLAQDDVDNDGDGYTENAGDCDDTDPNVHPGAAEICDGKDSNCDYWKAPTDVDNDGDGVPRCANDCNDNDPTAYPGAPEICDGLDNNCDYVVPTNERDLDGDGYRTCDVTPDCNDSDHLVNPGVQEFCGDLKDNNCNGQTDEAGCICPDNDGDGFTVSNCGGTDCDDSSAAVYPGAVEECNDGLDNDCDGLVDMLDPNAVNCPICTDADLDGYYVEGGGCGAIDCDDTDPNVNPGAAEICDGKDSNCDGWAPPADIDADGDGVAQCAGDCDDVDAHVFPGAMEICDGKDTNCDGTIPANEADADGDGITICNVPPDCDDNNPSVIACSLSGLNITCPSTLYVGEPGNCTANATGNGTINYSWSTSGNLTPSGNLADVYYVTDGAKDISVTASIVQYPAISDTVLANVDVLPFTVGLSCTNTALNLGELTTCDAASTAPSVITDYVWSSGNPLTINPQQGSSSVTVTAVGSGTETASVDLCTSTGYCQTATQDITITSPTITANIACPATIFKNQQDTCTVTANTSSGTYNLSYEWTSTGTITGLDENADVSFPSQGTHTVRVRVFLTDYPAVETTAAFNVTVTGYSKPQITIDGPTDVLIDSQVTYTARVDSPSGPVDITWDVDGTQYQGDTINLNFNTNAIRNIRVEARVQGSGGDTDALNAKLLRVVVHIPEITVYVRGDRKALVDMPGNYEAAITIADSPFYEQFMSELTGQWELYDGSMSTSNPIDVTFPASGTYTLQYRAWVPGYESYDKIVSINVRAEEYTFGPFSIHSYSRAEGVAPFYASVAATGQILGTSATEAGVKYYWSFEGESLSLGNNRASHVYKDIGDYTISLKVSDKYGNESSDSTSLTITPPPPLTLSLAAYYSNRAHYAPVTLATYPRISGGIRGDRLASYTWQINGVDVAPPPYMLIRRIDTPGTYTVNFSGTMDKSGQTISESFSFDVLENIGGVGGGVSTRGTMISISGNTKMLPDDDLSLSAAIVQEGTVRNDRVIEWTTPYGVINQSSMGLSADQVPDEGVQISVKGYLPDEPEKIYYNRIYVRRVLPARPTMRILSAPRSAIVGQPISLSGYAKASSINAGREISTEWKLPDGSIVAGNDLSHITRDSDFASNKMILEFRAWVNGYKAQSLNKLNAVVMKNPYLWPGSFTLEHTQGELFAPAGLTLKIFPVASEVPQYTLNSNLTYEWILPAGAIETLRRQNEIKARVDDPGTYNFSVNVSDALGNRASVPLTLDVLEKVATMDLLVTYDKSELVEPLRVSLRPRVLNLDGDIVTSIDYYEPLTGQTSQGSYATMDFPAGQYVIEITAYTSDGATIRKVHNLTVGPSTPPDCTIQYNISQSLKTVFMDTTCTDPDPKDGVTRYEWRVGSEILSYSYRAYYNYKTSGAVNVELTVMDKAGKTATFNQVIDIP